MGNIFIADGKKNLRTCGHALFLLCLYIKPSKKQETAESMHQLLLLKKGIFPIFNVASTPKKNEYFTLFMSNFR